jgi:uncharacterized protein YegL
MNTNLLTIVKQIIASHGEGILGDPQRLKSFFTDLAKDEPKPLRVAFGRCIEAGAYTALKTTPDAAARAAVKATIAQNLRAKHGLDLALCGEALDIMEAALYGTARMAYRQPDPKEPKAGADASGKTMQKKKPHYLLTAAALVTAALVGIAAYAQYSANTAKALVEKTENSDQPLVLFFVIDSSGSMEGSKIDALNTAMQEVIPAIRDLANESPGRGIEIAALAFDDGYRWLTPNGPISVEEFNWAAIDAAGMTELGAACRALDERLSASAFIQNNTTSFTPAIFLFSDGFPSDDWQSGLYKLKQNNSFNAAVKAAVAIGDDADKEVLKEFTGSMDSVLEVHNAAMLIEMIKFVSVRASQAANSDAEVKQKQEELNAALYDFTRKTAPNNSAVGGEW